VRPRFVSIAVPILNLLAGVVKAYEPLRDQTPVPKAVIERFEVRTLNGLSPANEAQIDTPEVAHASKRLDANCVPSSA